MDDLLEARFLPTDFITPTEGALELGDRRSPLPNPKDVTPLQSYAQEAVTQLDRGLVAILLRRRERT